MFNEYRVIKSGDTYTINLVTFDADRNPVSKQEIEPVSGSISDLTSSLIYQMSALTKPIIEAEVFEPLEINDSDVQTALNLIRNRNV